MAADNKLTVEIRVKAEQALAQIKNVKNHFGVLGSNSSVLGGEISKLSSSLNRLLPASAISAVDSIKNLASVFSTSARQIKLREKEITNAKDLEYVTNKIATLKTKLKEAMEAGNASAMSKYTSEILKNQKGQEQLELALDKVQRKLIKLDGATKSHIGSNGKLQAKFESLKNTIKDKVIKALDSLKDKWATFL